MSNPSTESLRSANANLRARLAGLSQPSSPSLSPKDISSLLAELLRAGECCRTVSPGSAPDGEMEKAISEYWSTLEQLAQILPRLHARLLTEKARLEIARAHVTATAAWAQANQNTL
jgi:hypothetical protein